MTDRPGMMKRAAPLAAGAVRGAGPSGEIEVRQLRVFLALVERRTLSRTATALGLAQSTVSEVIASLERSIGAAVIHRRRGSHGTVLTPAGEALVPQARRVLQEVRRVHLSVAGVSRNARFHMGVITNESVGTYLLAGAQLALRRDWPSGRFAVSIGTCEEVRAGVANGAADLGILLEPAADEGSEGGRDPRSAPPARSVILKDRVPLTLFGHARHPLVSTRPASLTRHQLTPFPVIIADAAGSFYDLLARFFAEGESSGPLLQSAGSIEGVKRGVVGDRSALGVLPHYAVSEDLKAGRVHALTLHPALPSLQLVAQVPIEEAEVHPAVASLLSLVRGAGL